MDQELKQYLDGKFAELDGKFAEMDGKFAEMDGKFAEMEANSKRDFERMEANSKRELERMEANSKRELERVETTLLTEFHKWASPAEARARTHTAAIRAVDLELEALTERVQKLEKPN